MGGEKDLLPGVHLLQNLYRGHFQKFWNSDEELKPTIADDVVPALLHGTALRSAGLYTAVEYWAAKDDGNHLRIDTMEGAASLLS